MLIAKRKTVLTLIGRVTEEILEKSFGIEKKINTKEKVNFIANEDWISLEKEYIHLLSSRCVDVGWEKRRASGKNSNLNILFVLFNRNIKIMMLIKIRRYVVFFFNNYIGIKFLYGNSLKNWAKGTPNPFSWRMASSKFHIDSNIINQYYYQK